MVLGTTVKVAVTLLAPVIESVQVDTVPTQSPVHALKMKPRAGTAVRVTTVPAVNVVPDGDLLIVPLAAEVVRV
jgi:hypothetical protein